MLRVGLTGGLASGKSFVGRALADLGCLLIQADELGHHVLEPGGEAYAGVIQEFGSDIVTADGNIDRRKLTALVHPPVWARERRLLDEYAAAHPHGIAVVEAAILVETGSYRDYAKLIV